MVARFGVVDPVYKLVDGCFVTGPTTAAANCLSIAFKVADLYADGNILGSPHRVGSTAAVPVRYGLTYPLEAPGRKYLVPSITPVIL